MKLFGVFPLTFLVGFKSFFLTSNGAAVRNTVLGSSGSSSGGFSGSDASGGGGGGAPFVPNPCLSNPDCLSPTVQLHQMGSSGSASYIDCNTKMNNQFSGALSGQIPFNPCSVVGSSGPGGLGSSSSGSGGSASYIDCNTNTQNAISSQMGFDPCAITAGSSGSETHFETPCIFGKRSSGGCLTYTVPPKPQPDYPCHFIGKRFPCYPGPCYTAAKRYLCDPSPCMIKRYACNPNPYFQNGNLFGAGANLPDAALGSSMSGGA